MGNNLSLMLKIAIGAALSCALIGDAAAGRLVRGATPKKAAQAAAVETLTNATGLPLSGKHIVDKGGGVFETRQRTADGQPLGRVKIKARATKQGGLAFTNPSGAKSLRPMKGVIDTTPLNRDFARAKPLAGKTVVVLVESQFVPQELELYAKRFAAYGAKVTFVSRLWGNEKLRFHSHVDLGFAPELRFIDVATDISEVNLTDGKVVAVVQSVHTQQRLLYDGGIAAGDDAIAATRQAPAVRLVAEALLNPRVVMGAMGHGVEILAPLGEIIRGARITASLGSVVHVVNAGGVWVKPADPKQAATHVVVEPSTKTVPGLNLVTGTSLGGGGNAAFIDAITTQVLAVRANNK